MLKKIIFIMAVILSLSLLADELELNIKNCKRKDANACHLIGTQYYLAESNAKKALPFFAKACELNDAQACFTTAFIGNQFNMKDDIFKFYLNKSCKLGYEPACIKTEQMK